MKILFLVEGRKISPNFVIADKIAKELSKENDVYCAYWYVTDCLKAEEYSHYKDVIGLCIPKSNMLDTYNRVLSFNNRNDKIKYLICHPRFALYYLRYRLSRKLNYGSSHKKIEAYCEQNGIDYVIGCSMPYEIACILAKVKTSLKKGLLQLDPYSTNPILEGNIKRRARREQIVYKNIDRLFTTRYIINDLIKMGIANEHDGKCVEIEFPLINKENVTCISTENEFIKDKNEISFAHIGSFYEDLRNPKCLVDIFERLPENCVLYVAGVNSSLIRKYDINIRHRVRDLGLLSKDKAEKLKQEADVLICLNNKTNNMVPSKFFECIDTGKPFINICQISDCPTLDYINDYPNVYTIFTYEDIEKNTGLKLFLSKRIGICVDRNVILKRYNACTVEYVAQRVCKC